MRAAIIENGLVENVVVVTDQALAEAHGWIINDTANIGDRYDPDTGQFTPPPRWATLADAQQDTLIKIDQSREDAFAAGLNYEINGHPDVVQTRLQDKINLLGLRLEAQELNSAGVTDAVMPFRAESNTGYQLTPQQMIDLTDAALAHIQAIYQQSWQLKDAITTAKTQDELVVIEWP